MLTKFCPPLFLDHKVEIYVRVQDAMLWDESPVVKRRVVQRFIFSCMNFLGLSGRGGGTRELEPTLFLFFGTIFFGAIEKKRG